jgi:DNA (cytosine-5)-methyltransferase 1
MVDPRPGSDPAHTITGKGTAAWVQDRPSTTVCGDPRIGRPGHKDRDQGEAQFAQDSVRVTVQEAGSCRASPPTTRGRGRRLRSTDNAATPCPLLAAARGRDPPPPAASDVWAYATAAERAA